jgi:hypothetical protein
MRKKQFLQVVSSQIAVLPADYINTLENSFSGNIALDPSLRLNENERKANALP